MNRKPRPSETSDTTALFSSWQQQLLSRRRFLLAAAGGSVAAMFPLPSPSATTNNKPAAASDPWPVIAAVQQHLFPAEKDAPGAAEINAPAYLQFVVSDRTLDADEREFILQGTRWLQDITEKKYKTAFIELDYEKREQVLRHIASSSAGENWLSTLLLYIFEALLTDPVYGGNKNQAGWKWLQHTPGFPRPPADKTFQHLLKI